MSPQTLRKEFLGGGLSPCFPYLITPTPTPQTQVPLCEKPLRGWGLLGPQVLGGPGLVLLADQHDPLHPAPVIWGGLPGHCEPPGPHQCHGTPRYQPGR